MNTIFPDTFTPVLTGQHNFRDLGGILTNDGKRISPGLLYRSGDLHSITDEDLKTLTQLGLAMIIDFRSPREIEKRPNREIPGVKEVKHLPIYDAPRDLAARYVEESNEEGLKQLLIGEYERIILHYTAEYRQFLHEVVHNPNVPLVFHCSAGKDRTGLATIFLLTALGVGKEEILEDYFRTNIFAQAHAHEIIGILNNDGHNGELMRPMLEVRQEYLDAAFLVIHKRYSNLENFVFDELAANPELLQERYLE
ncbi:MAG TPA: tyrosine-protein phosphatase [Bacteroidales bacterium]|nr:tyrosine-protein phosphatase [Bacteroidales bacterium]